MKHKFLICGLPGSGKTTLAKALAPLLGAVHFDGDIVRMFSENADFSIAGRERQANLMRMLCDQVVDAGGVAVASFIAPTPNCRDLFDADYTIFCDRIVASKYADTNRIWEAPSDADYTVLPEGSAVNHAMRIAIAVQPVFDQTKPTALVVGRFQPVHDGHIALIEEALRRVGQVCIGVRTMPQDTNNPFKPAAVRQMLHKRLNRWDGQFRIVELPNIAAVFYGRDVGYVVEKLDLDTETEKVHASDIREEIFDAPNTGC